MNGDLPEGFTLVQPQTEDTGLPPGFSLVQPSVASDVGQTVIPSLEKGTAEAAAMPFAIPQLGLKAADWLASHALPEGAASSVHNFAQGGQQALQKPIDYIYNFLPKNMYEPQTETGKVVGSALEFLPSAVYGGVGTLGGRALAAILGGVGSKYGGDVAKYFGVPEWEGKVAGGLLGGLGGPKLLKSAAVTPERAAQAAILKQHGVPLTAGQETGSPWMLQREANLMTPKRAAQEAGNYTQAAATEAGMPGTRALSQDALREGFKNMKAAEGRVAQAEITPNNFSNLMKTVGDIRRQAYKTLRDKGIGPIDEQIAAMKGTPGAMSIPGARYQYLRGELQSALEEAKNSQTKHYLGELRKSLDNAMSKEFPPGELDKIHQTTTNYHTLARGHPWAGETAEPKTLQKAIGKGASAITHPLTPLAQAGESVLKRPKATEAGGRFARALGGMGGWLLGAHNAPTATSGATEAFVPAIFGREAANDIAGLLLRNPATRALYFNPASQYYLKHGVPGLNKLAGGANTAGMVRALLGPEAAQLQFTPGTPSYPYYQR